MNQLLQQAIKHWDYVAPLSVRPKNKKEFEQLVTQLDRLLEMVGGDENHRLMGLVDMLSNIIADYESTQHPHEMRGTAALRFLMESHHLRQCDLPEIASQGVLSEILSGKRSLSLRQIKSLAKRFHVDPATFIDAEL